LRGKPESRDEERRHQRAAADAAQADEEADAKPAAISGSTRPIQPRSIMTETPPCPGTETGKLNLDRDRNAGRTHECRKFRTC
jgi:hypothetical protein